MKSSPGTLPGGARVLTPGRGEVPPDATGTLVDAVSYDDTVAPGTTHTYRVFVTAAGGPVDRAEVLLSFLRALEVRYRRWTAVLLGGKRELEVTFSADRPILTSDKARLANLPRLVAEIPVGVEPVSLRARTDDEVEVHLGALDVDLEDVLARVPGVGQVRDPGLAFGRTGGRPR